jgi:hypothetical protein
MNKQAKFSLIIILAVVLVLAVGFAIAKPGDKGKSAKECNDKVDNDGDGYKDYPADPGCSSKQDTSELNPNVECDDGVDNADTDSLIDWNDPGCIHPANTSEIDGECDDTVDNGDADSLADLSDPGCVSTADPSEVDGECDDTVDNDGDNATDYPNDGGCDNYSDNDETDCGDGVCEGNETNVTCPEDCEIIPDSCSDTDGGYNIFVLGNVTGYLNGDFYSDWDFCSTGTELIEYACSGDYAYNYTVDCTQNATSCSGGVCV